jgi:predicted ester cyclase
MPASDLADRTRRLIEVGFGRGDLSVLDELMADDVIEHQRGNRPGREGAKEVVGTLHRWMTDFSLTVEDLAIAGDTVWTRNRARGVNTGSVMGSPASGRPVEIDVIDIVRFADGRVVEHWGVADQVGLMQQVGAIPGRPRPVTAGA